MKTLSKLNKNRLSLNINPQGLSAISNPQGLSAISLVNLRHNPDQMQHYIELGLVFSTYLFAPKDPCDVT